MPVNISERAVTDNPSNFGNDRRIFGSIFEFHKSINDSKKEGNNSNNHQKKKKTVRATIHAKRWGEESGRSFAIRNSKKGICRRVL